MESGQKNKRIDINLKTNGIDDSGFDTITTSLIKKCWAKCGELSGALQLQAVNVKLENTVLFTVRYCSALKDLDSEKYKNRLEVVFRGRNYNVYFVDYHNFNQEEITFKCLEVI